MEMCLAKNKCSLLVFCSNGNLTMPCLGEKDWIGKALAPCHAF